MVNLKIAIQKSGRLHDQSMALLRECGISIDNGGDQLIARSSNFPLEVLFLRNSDIPQYVDDGVADVAIIGSNTELECPTNIVRMLDLGFSRCRLSIAVPRETEFAGLSWLAGKRIATSYPNSLRGFLAENGITAEVHVISGSVEIAPGIGIADAVCDLVSSGSTLIKNGLREVHTVFKSEAVLVANPSLDFEKRAVLDRLIFRVRAALAAKNNKYILLNAPRERVGEICALIPGIKSPTILPLGEPGWVSLHSVVNEDRFWEVIDSLRTAGAEGILVVPIEKMIT
ncbi:MAG: ATP phosphoribosyltransferase [Rikenellaceae bacterium]|nr:ATP phosphoribosyltransferase [Rikenellaceae bacterium]MCL2692966.1 ATP phosphoribosyltransferase [Rikenellaceae bacterium]